MNSIRITPLIGVAAEAALEVPGVVDLQPRLAHRLAAAATRTRTDTTPHRTLSESGIRANRAPDGSGWHIEVRCVLAEDQRVLDIARNVHDRVEAAALSYLAALGVAERVHVEVTVTRIAARHTL
jgi:uncharacterized alkaline shock family protein YloU